MSALCQWRTHAAQQNGLLFDHLVGSYLQGRRHFEAKRFGCFEIDDKFEFRQPFDWQVAWLSAPEDTTNIESGMTISFHHTIAITHQAASGDELTVHGCHRITGREADYLYATAK